MSSRSPIRSCVACRTRRPQEELLRVVRVSNGTVRVDEDRHRASGRGAYVCPTEACLRLAERRQCFRRALKGDVTTELAESLHGAAARKRGDALE